MKAEITNEKNLNKKLYGIENMLDLIEEDLEGKNNLYNFPTNIIHIMPDIQYQWSLIQNSEDITLFELIDICEIWVEELAACVVSNKSRLKNKKITKHMYDLVEICRFVVFMTHNWLMSLNQE